MKHFSEMEVKVKDAPYTCNGRGCIRIILHRTQEQMKLDGIKKSKSNNLVWWDYSEPTPKYTMSSVDEKLTDEIIYHAFKISLGVTKENHLEYAMKAGKIFKVKPEDIAYTNNNGPVVSKFNCR